MALLSHGCQGVCRGGSETEELGEGLSKFPEASFLPMPSSLLGETHPALLRPPLAQWVAVGVMGRGGHQLGGHTHVQNKETQASEPSGSLQSSRVGSAHLCQLGQFRHQEEQA